MTTVLILHYAGPPVVGGVEITIYHHARLLAARGYDVHVAAGRGSPFHPRVAFHHIPRLDSRHPDALTAARELKEHGRSDTALRLANEIADYLTPLFRQAHVVIVHNALTLHKNWGLTIALHQLNEARVCPILAWCHDFAWMDDLYLPEMRPGFPWDLLRTPWPGVRYVVVSQHRRRMLAELLRLPEDDIAVVSPGVDVAEFFKLEETTRHLARRLRLLEAEPLLLLPARVTRRKNIEMGIRVVAALKRHMPHPILIVTGPPGPHNPTNIAYLNALRDLRRDLDVEAHVHFLYEYGEGDAPLHVTDAMMSDFYHLADVLLFPSRREGFGIPVLEAGLARLPIFAADIPPIHESAGPLAFYFDPDGDPDAVARAIADHLRENTAYHMRKRVLREFTWERIIEEKVVPLLDVAVGEWSGE